MDFDALHDGGVYLYGRVTMTMLADMRDELIHQFQRRKHEFEQALKCVAREQDPGQVSGLCSVDQLGGSAWLQRVTQAPCKYKGPVRLRV